jgi:hypothetical protein
LLVETRRWIFGGVTVDYAADASKQSLLTDILHELSSEALARCREKLVNTVALDMNDSQTIPLGVGNRRSICKESLEFTDGSRAVAKGLSDSIKIGHGNVLESLCAPLFEFRQQAVDGVFHH